MSSDSYSWTSSAASDPNFSQRATHKQQQRNQRHAAELAALRRRSASADPSKVKIPEYLRKQPTAASEPQQVEDTLATQRQRVRQAIAKYI